MKRVLSLLPIIFFIALPLNAKEVEPVTLKLAFLSGFAKFTHWHDHRNLLKVCFVENQDIDPKIYLLEGQDTPNGHINILAVKAQPEQISCDMFIANGMTESSLALLNSYAQKNTLVICNECATPEIADIVLYRKRNRLAFDVHLGNVQKKPFKFSSNLLELAAEVKK